MLRQYSIALIWFLVSPFTPHLFFKFFQSFAKNTLVIPLFLFLLFEIFFFKFFIIGVPYFNGKYLISFLFTNGAILNYLVSVYILKIIFHINKIPHQMKELFLLGLMLIQAYLLFDIYSLFGIQFLFLNRLIIFVINYKMLVVLVPLIVILVKNYHLNWRKSTLLMIGFMILKLFVLLPFMGINF